MDYRKLIKEEIAKLHTAKGVEVNPKLDSDLGEQIVADICRNVVKPLLPAVFLSGKDKVEQFQKELKSLLAKYDAELEIQDFGRNWLTDEKIVVTFAWDEDLSNRTNDGIVPDWVVGRWENGS
jgi:hypothetical protein